MFIAAWLSQSIYMAVSWMTLRDAKNVFNQTNSLVVPAIERYFALAEARETVVRFLCTKRLDIL